MTCWRAVQTLSYVPVDLGERSLHNRPADLRQPRGDRLGEAKDLDEQETRDRRRTQFDVSGWLEEQLAQASPDLRRAVGVAL
jgi:hypothetical protein